MHDQLLHYDIISFNVSLFEKMN